MSLTADEVMDPALALPGEKRLELAETLLASLDSADRPAMDESWRAVIRRHSAELRAGQVVGVPWEEVKHRAQEQAGC
jgi:putative addiction module component (TIGR02574 family)